MVLEMLYIESKDLFMIWVM